MKSVCGEGVREEGVEAVFVRRLCGGIVRRLCGYEDCRETVWRVCS